MCASLSLPLPDPCPLRAEGFSVDEKLTYLEQSGMVASSSAWSLPEGPDCLISVACKEIHLLSKAFLIFRLEGKISFFVF